MTKNNSWWKTTTIYQIYPRSFMDSNGDGIGDLRGIISKLDYIQKMGFETIWISPFFSSPQADWGYDVSDYYDIAPEYGKIADVEELIAEVHQRGMRVLFDLVLNHTSDQHPWFIESRSSVDSPKRNWYIWRVGRGNRPPNNWKAIPGGSGWHYDESTNQWYYASFLPFQPDLNFRNPELKKEMFNVVRFWMDKGVDGFRLDIFHAIYKDEQFRDNPFSWRFFPKEDKAGYFQLWLYNLHQPESFQLAKELRNFVEPYSPRGLLLGEIAGDDEMIKAYLGENNEGLNLVFLWNLLNAKGKASFLCEIIRHYEATYPEPYTPVIVFGNHDQKRLLSKIGGDIRIAKLLALFQLTLRGVPVVYYGEEIGMQDVELSAKDAKDPIGRQYAWLPRLIANSLGLYLNRDGCRKPMQWDGTKNAGFCPDEIEPWLPVHGNHVTENVTREGDEPNSLLNVYRTLLNYRKQSEALSAGSLQLLEESLKGKNLLAYFRESNNEKVLVVINFGNEASEYANTSACREIVLCIGMHEAIDAKHIVLPPKSGVILQNKSQPIQSH